MSSNSKAFAASVALLAAIGLAVFGQGIAPSGSIAPMTLDSSGDLSSPGTFMTGVNSGLNAAYQQTSSASGNPVYTLQPSSSALSGMTAVWPLNGLSQTHTIGTGTQLFSNSSGGATCSTSNKFFAIGNDSGSTTEINHVWMVPDTIGTTGVLTIASISAGIQATQTTGALTVSLDYYRCGTVGSGTCTGYTGPTTTGVTVTIANGSAAGVYQSTANTFNVNAGDYLSFNCVNSSGTSPNTFSFGAKIQ